MSQICKLICLFKGSRPRLSQIVTPRYIINNLKKACVSVEPTYESTDLSLALVPRLPNIFSILGKINCAPLSHSTTKYISIQHQKGFYLFIGLL